MEKLITIKGQKIETIYFDLDGPILDVSERHFYVHKLICLELGIDSKLKPEIYWQKKRKNIQLFDLLNTREEKIINQYKKLWIENIEREQYIYKDRIFPFVKESLETIYKKYCLVLVTLRMKKNIVLNEIKRFGISKYFKDILIASSRNNPDHISKYQEIKKLSYFSKNAFLIGDTEVDIETAKLLGIRSISVLSGIRNRENLLQAGADIIIRDIKSLGKILK